MRSIKGSLKRIKDYIIVSYSLMGRTSKILLLISTMIGLFTAIVEYGFISVLQNFLASSGILQVNSGFINISGWETLPMASLLLILIGIIRSFLEGIKIYISRLAMQNFATEMREKIISFALDIWASMMAISLSKVVASLCFS